MDRHRILCILLITVFLLAAISCGGLSPASAQPAATPEPTAEPTPDPVVEAETVSRHTPVPTEAVTLAPVPTPSPTPEPTPTPTPSPTPVPERIGILRYELNDRFSETVVDTEDTYCDPSRSITLTRVETKERTGKTLVYFVADIYVQNVESIRRGIHGKSFTDIHLRSLKQLSEECDAIIAMSGDHCTVGENGYVVINGEVQYQSKKLNRDLCVLYRDGVLKTYAPKDINPDMIEARGVWQTWNFGPTLLDDDGEPLKTFNLPDHVEERNPRAAIGYYEPGHYCFVLVDGRQNGYSMGLTLDELALLMKDLGCTAAYNLDGGISAQIAWHSQRVNHPGADRTLADIVYIPYHEEMLSEEGDEP